MILPVLLLMLAAGPQVTVAPPSPTVGDPITLQFPGGNVEIKPSEDFEVVQAKGARAVIRSFRTGQLRVEYVRTEPGQTAVEGVVEVSVASVLKPNDDLSPAPLKPPRPLPDSKLALRALGIAAAAAALAWILVALALRIRTRRELAASVPAIDPTEEFMEALARARARHDRESQWVDLSGATRQFLSRVDPSLGRELTTTELLATMRRLGIDVATVTCVDEILHGGDWTKFSPYGAPREEISALFEKGASLGSLAKKPREEGEAA